jgi:hypothetical protein
VFSTVCLSYRLRAYVTKIKTESKKKTPNGVHRLRSEKKSSPPPIITLHQWGGHPFSAKQFFSIKLLTIRRLGEGCFFA